MAVVLDVRFRGFRGMMERMNVMSMSYMRVVTCCLVVARLMMFCRLFMVLCRVLMMFGRLTVVFRCRLRHCAPSFLGIVGRPLEPSSL